MGMGLSRHHSFTFPISRVTLSESFPFCSRWVRLFCDNNSIPRESVIHAQRSVNRSVRRPLNANPQQNRQRGGGRGGRLHSYAAFSTFIVVACLTRFPPRLLLCGGSFGFSPRSLAFCFQFVLESGISLSSPPTSSSAASLLAAVVVDAAFVGATLVEGAVATTAAAVPPGDDDDGNDGGFVLEDEIFFLAGALTGAVGENEHPMLPFRCDLRARALRYPSAIDRLDRATRCTFIKKVNEGIQGKR